MNTIIPTLLLILVSSNFAYVQEDNICGAGTIFVYGKCIPDPDIKTVVHRDCLIATASYGSELAPQAQMLREIRDNTLLNTASGKIFMDGFSSIHCSFSLQIAQLEAENLFFKAVRLFMTPMITTLSMMTLAQDDSEFDVLFLGMSAIGMIVGMCVVAPVAVVWKIRKRKYEIE